MIEMARESVHDASVHHARLKRRVASTRSPMSTVFSRHAMPLVVRLLALLLVVIPAAHAAGDKDGAVYGLELMPWAKKIEEGRYQSPRDYEATKKFFKDKFKGWKSIRWHAEVSLPNVKYVHVENTATKRSWDGVNIYEMPGGHVRIFVLPHVAPAAPTVPAKKPDAPSAAPKAP